jgi:glycosyltransferase involved in cell wall biosynthesis
MCAGKTVVTSGNIATWGTGILQNGRNIVLVERGRPDALADTLIGLLADPIRRASIGHAAQETMARHFSWSRIGDLTLELYRDVSRRSHTECGDLSPLW